MKLIIQIPCYNEEDNLDKVLKSMPKKINGIDIIEFLVVSDGSTDRTVEIARKFNVHHIIEKKHNEGLAKTFMNGIFESLRLGADIIVNIDGDFQYNGKEISKLISPIVEKKADMVIGSRDMKVFGSVKRFLQKLGSFFVRLISGTNVVDATSGFRAFSRECALHLNVYNNFSYTLETIIQIGHSDMVIENVSVSSIQNTRKSRLFKNYLEYIIKSIVCITRACFIYKPISTFCLISFTFLISFLISLICGLYFDLFILLLLSLLLFLLMCCSILFMINASIIKANRYMLEEIQYSLRNK